MKYNDSGLIGLGVVLGLTLAWATAPWIGLAAETEHVSNALGSMLGAGIGGLLAIVGALKAARMTIKAQEELSIREQEARTKSEAHRFAAMLNILADEWAQAATWIDTDDLEASVADVITESGPQLKNGAKILFNMDGPPSSLGAEVQTEWSKMLFRLSGLVYMLDDSGTKMLETDFNKPKFFLSRINSALQSIEHTLAVLKKVANGDLPNSISPS